jgi:hypothetical protein
VETEGQAVVALRPELEQVVQVRQGKVLMAVPVYLTVVILPVVAVALLLKRVMLEYKLGFKAVTVVMDLQYLTEQPTAVEAVAVRIVLFVQAVLVAVQTAYFSLSPQLFQLLQTQVAVAVAVHHVWLLFQVVQAVQVSLLFNIQTHMVLQLLQRVLQLM